MKIVVGLGNPGKRYERTPHNAGFAVADELAKELSCNFRRSLRFQASVGRAALDEQALLLVKPRTYMNRSGAAVAALMRYHRVAPEDLIVVLDDADLAVGRLRIRAGGSSGGHKGLASVIERIDGADVVRVRVGIGRQDGPDLVRHVLSVWSGEKWRAFGPVLQRAAQAVFCVLREGPEAAMNRFNGASDTDER